MGRLVAAEKGKSSDEIPNEPPPFYYDVSYIFRTWLNHRKHGTYPEAGAYNDQCPFLMEDWSNMTLWHIRVEMGVMSSFSMPNNAPEWMSSMGD